MAIADGWAGPIRESYPRVEGGGDGQERRNRDVELDTEESGDRHRVIVTLPIARMARTDVSSSAQSE